MLFGIQLFSLGKTTKQTEKYIYMFWQFIYKCFLSTLFDQKAINMYTSEFFNSIHFSFLLVCLNPIDLTTGVMVRQINVWLIIAGRDVSTFDTLRSKILRFYFVGGRVTMNSGSAIPLRVHFLFFFCVSLRNHWWIGIMNWFRTWFDWWSWLMKMMIVMMMMLFVQCTWLILFSKKFQ